MFGAVTGYYYNKHIVLRDKVSWDNGQEVMVIVIPKKSESNGQEPLDFSKFRSGGRYGIDIDAQDYIEELSLYPKKKNL